MTPELSAGDVPIYKVELKGNTEMEKLTTEELKEFLHFTEVPPLGKNNLKNVVNMYEDFYGLSKQANRDKETQKLMFTCFILGSLNAMNPGSNFNKKYSP